MLVFLLEYAYSRETAKKVVNVRFLMSENLRQKYLAKGYEIEDKILKFTDELEKTLDKDLLSLETPMTIKFVPSFSTELPPGVDLDKCGTDMIELGDKLNFINEDDSLSSAIAIFSCKSDPYNNTFEVSGLKVPYITHTLTTECTTRTLIFAETEQPKLKAVVTTALIKAAGVLMKNPLIFEEVNDGDNGVTYEIRVNSGVIESLASNECFYSP